MSDARDSEPIAAAEADIALANWVADLVERIEAGEPVDLSSLAMTHPEQEELRRILPTVRRMVSFGRASPSVEERPAPDSKLGTLGDFRLLREVGRGGMGIVFEAEQISLRRRVALKILPLAAALDPRHHQRFLLEARAAACLHHTYIVPVHAVGSERGVPYYAMQFIDGCTLAQILEQLRDHGHVVGAGSGPVSSLGASSRDRGYTRAAAEHGRRAAEALDHAHSRGIIHRDIKPSNLMLDAEGHLWITDFGLAQIQGDSRLTLTGDLMGTLRYMSPEQALGRRVVIDGRADLYSLGATLYELLALRPVFEGADRAEILRKIAQDEPTPLHKLNAAVPRDLETIIHKALAKEPSERYATARELADDLGRFLDARPITARPPGRLEHFSKWTRRNRAVVLPAVVCAAVALIVLIGDLIWSNNWLSRHNERLRIEHDRATELSGQLKEQRDLAEERRSVADRHLYAFRLRQADEALRARKLVKAQEILRDCRPGEGEDDLRGFAWHYLWREARKDIAVLSERSELVWSLALSPDGRTLATGDDDGTIRLRDPATGQVAMSLRGHKYKVGFLAFSPDGRRLASVDYGGPSDPNPASGEVRLWEVDSGRPLARLQECIDADLLAFDALGEHLWVLSQDRRGLTRLDQWDVKTDPARPRLSWSRLLEEARPPRAGDGLITVIEGAGRGFRLRDLAEATRLGWTGTISFLRGQPVAGSPDGRSLAVGAGSWVVLWDVRADRQGARYKVPPGTGLFSIGFSPDSRFLTVEFHPVDGCEIHDLRNGAVQTIPPVVADLDLGVPRSQAFSPDGRFFARSFWKQGAPQPTKVWQLDPWREIADSSGVLLGVTSLLYTRDGSLLVVGLNHAAIRWNYAPPPEPSQPDGHKDEAWTAAFSTDGRLLATGSDDTDDPQTLKIWDAATARLVRGWKAHEGAMTSAVAFQPSGGLLASAGLLNEKNLRLWDAATGGLLATLEGHTDKVRGIAFSPDGGLLASAGSDRTVRLWDMATWRHLRTLTGHSDTVRQIAFSPDGRTLASVGNDATVRVWNTEGTEPVWSWKGGVKIAAVAYSPDGKTLAWVHEDGVIQRWDLTRNQSLAALHSEYEELRCMAFSPDGRILAVAGKSGSIHLWDPVSGQELLTLEGRPCQVNSLAFAPDGSALAACWHDGTVRIIRAR